MRSTTRKGLPLPEITDAYNQNFTVGPPGRTFSITGVVRDTDNAQSNILDNMTEFNQDEVITGKWVFQSPLNAQAGIGRRLTNNTGSQRILGDVVMLDPSNDLAFLQPSAANIASSRIGVVAETIAAGQVGYVAFTSFIQVHVVGGVTRLQYLQSQQNSYTAAASSLAGSGSFAIVMSAPDASNMVVAMLGVSSSLQGGGTVQGPFTWSVIADSVAWLLDAGARTTAGIQISPRAVWRANAYDTSNHQRNFIWRARTTANNGLGLIELLTSLDGGAETSLLTVDNTGLLTPVGGIDLTAAAQTVWTYPASAVGDIPNRARFRARTGQTVLSLWAAADHVNLDSSIAVWMGTGDPGSTNSASGGLATVAAQNQVQLTTGGQLTGQTNSPSLVLAPAGTTRLTVPPVGALQVVGDMTMTGNLTSVNGLHTGVLNVTGAVGFSSTLTVTGMSSLAGGATITGNASVSGTTTLSGGVLVNGSFTIGNGQQGSVAGNWTVGGSVFVTGGVTATSFNPTNGIYYFVDANMYIARSGGEWIASHQLGVPVLRVGTGYLRDLGGATLRVDNHLNISYDFYVGRTFQVAGNSTVQYLHAANRLVTNNYDVGWPNNFGGNSITSGYFYQRGRGDCRCWDNLDFTYTPSDVGNTLVQRDGNGAFVAGNCTFYGASVAGDLYCAATFYVMSGGTIAFQVVANSGEVFTNSDVHMNHCRAFSQVAAFNSYNNMGNANAFLCLNAGDYTGQGLANQWRTYSCVDHAQQYGLPYNRIRNALDIVKNISGYSYDHAWFEPGKIDEPIKQNGQYKTTLLHGFMASEVAKLLPNIAGASREGGVPDQIDYGRMVPVLWEAVKELSEQVAALQAKAGA